MLIKIIIIIIIIIIITIIIIILINTIYLQFLKFDKIIQKWYNGFSEHAKNVKMDQSVPSTKMPPGDPWGFGRC